MATRGIAHTVEFMAWDTTNNVGKTGDGANFTMRWVKDGTSAALTTTTVTEIDSTNCPGLYKVGISSTEADCNMGWLHGKSSTSGISIIPVKVEFERLPDASPGAQNQGVALAGANVSISGVSTGAATQIWQATQRSLTDAVAVSGTVAATISLPVTVSGMYPSVLEQIGLSGWAVPTRLLTGGTNIVLTKNVGLLGLNDLSQNDVSGVVQSGLSQYGVSTPASVWSYITRSLNQPVAVSGLNDLSAAQVWSYTTRSLNQPVSVSGVSNQILTDISGVVTSGVWNHTTRTLTSAGSSGATAAEVWSYTTRGLTEQVSVSGINPATAGVIGNSGWATASRTLTGAVAVSGSVPSVQNPVAVSGTVSATLSNPISISGVSTGAATQIWQATTRSLNQPVAVSGSVPSVQNPVAVSGNVLGVTNPVSVSGVPTVNVIQISGDSVAAYNLATQAKTVAVGEVRSSGLNSITEFLTNLTGYSTNFFGDETNGGCVIAFTSDSANKFLTRRVIGSTTLGSIKVESALDIIPSGNLDKFVILGRIEI